MRAGAYDACWKYCQGPQLSRQELCVAVRTEVRGCSHGKHLEVLKLVHLKKLRSLLHSST